MMGIWLDGGWKGDDICFRMHESPLCRFVFAKCDLPFCHAVEYVFFCFAECGVCTTSSYGRVSSPGKCLNETISNSYENRTGGRCAWATVAYQRERLNVLHKQYQFARRMLCRFECMLELVHAKSDNFRFTVPVSSSSLPS